MSEEDKSGNTVMRRIRRLTAPKDREQLRDVLKSSAQNGLLDTDALSMVEGVLDVADLQVRDIMVPHNQMICVRADDPAARILSVAIDSGHSRFPVLEAEGEKVVGILLAKDLLRFYTLGANARFDLREWMRKPLFVPESKRVNVLLKELRAGRNHMAVVIDEYGSVAGLVTMEDVIEQIVGDIDDEYDIEDEKNIRREGERQFQVRGATRIGEFNEYFGASFADDDYDTVAGLVTGYFGRMPRRGEAALLEGYEFRVLRADRRRIDALRVTVPESSDSTPDAVAATRKSG
ncbi:MAG: CBS domain-containing protein [Pseudomonadota bacterium]|nr:CBS domain-containing protein [Pseudomonadota bacterium]